MAPLICTTNTHSHVDYGIPIHVGKSTDYRTSTGKNHRYIPNKPQEFDCRVKLKLQEELLKTDIAIKEDVKSSYNAAYVPISDDDVLKGFKASQCEKVKATRNMQEKFYKNLVPPWRPGVSEMKDNYRLQYGYKDPVVLPPAVYAHCQISGTEGPLQPTVPPEEKGFWKHLDNYMTTNKLMLCGYTEEQIAKARQDIVTFYAATGKWKSLKNPLPGPLSGNKSVYDKMVFKYQYPVKFLSRAPKCVPNSGMQTEYGGNYVPQTTYKMYPYLNESGVHFDDSLPGASPWQYNCPPGMYCTEYCHTGTGWPVNSTVDIGLDKKHLPFKPHEPCNVKVQTGGK